MKRILSIDGGGIRGIIPAVILDQIEKSKGKPVAELFDLIAGTSTGGIIAVCLTKPGNGNKPEYSALDIVKLYEKEGSKIFNKTLWKSVMSLGNLVDEKYSHKGIEEVLQTYLGDTRLSQCLTEVIIPCYETERRFTFFFKSHKAKSDATYNYMLREVARSTSAAPTYFEPSKVIAEPPVNYYSLIDGGVFANNPAMCAYVEAKKIFGEEEDFLVVSLGTGELNRRIAYDDAKNWGLAYWARPLLNVVFDGVSDVVDYHLNQLLNISGSKKKYFRFKTILDEGNDNLDDASATNIRVLILKARKLLTEKNEELNAICELL
jgi:patatin-like phospholipase/acyl hydrolase